MKLFKKISYMMCLSALMCTVCGCDPDPEEPGNADVRLTYVFGCSEELMQFVTPTIKYTDMYGDHEMVMDENAWSPNRRAWCYKEEDGKRTYDFVDLDEDGNAPSPWVKVREYSSYSNSYEIKLDRTGIENTYTVEYHKKDAYSIVSSKMYDMHRLLSMPRGSVSYGRNQFSYMSIDLTIGSEDKNVPGSELEEFIDNLCANKDVITIVIDKDGHISNKQEQEEKTSI